MPELYDDRQPTEWREHLMTTRGGKKVVRRKHDKLLRIRRDSKIKTQRQLLDRTQDPALRAPKTKHTQQKGYIVSIVQYDTKSGNPATGRTKEHEMGRINAGSIEEAQEKAIEKYGKDYLDYVNEEGSPHRAIEMEIEENRPLGEIEESVDLSYDHIVGDYTAGWRSIKNPDVPESHTKVPNGVVIQRFIATDPPQLDKDGKDIPGTEVKREVYVTAVDAGTLEAKRTAGKKLTEVEKDALVDYETERDTITRSDGVTEHRNRKQAKKWEENHPLIFFITKRNTITNKKGKEEEIKPVDPDTGNRIEQKPITMFESGTKTKSENSVNRRLKTILGFHGKDIKAYTKQKDKKITAKTQRLTAEEQFKQKQEQQRQKQLVNAKKNEARIYNRIVQTAGAKLVKERGLEGDEHKEDRKALYGALGRRAAGLRRENKKRKDSLSPAGQIQTYQDVEKHGEKFVDSKKLGTSRSTVRSGTSSTASTSGRTNPKMFRVNRYNELPASQRGNVDPIYHQTDLTASEYETFAREEKVLIDPDLMIGSFRQGQYNPARTRYSMMRRAEKNNPEFTIIDKK